MNVIHSNMNGFTLIELMIAVAIVAILAAVAIPSYQGQVDSSRRAEGISALVTLSSAQERFYTANNRYASSAVALNMTQSETGVYTLSTSHSQDGGGVDIVTTYTLTATPSGWTDSQCGNLTLDNIGNRSISASTDTSVIASCWGK